MSIVTPTPVLLRFV